MLMTCRYVAELFSLTYTTIELATLDIGKRKEQCRIALIKTLSKESSNILR